jgi:hypothetical protein
LAGAIVVVVVAAAGAILIPRCAARGDVGIYLDAGRAVLENADPYAGSSVGTGYLYPPFFAFMMAPLTPCPLFGVAALWFVVNAGALVLLFATSLYLLESPPSGMAPWFRNKLAALADGKFNWVVVGSLILTVRFWFDNLAYGHINILVWGLSLLAVYFVVVGKRVAGGALLGAAVATKFITAPVLLFLIMRKEYRAALFALATAAALYIAPAAIVGWGRNGELLSAWYGNVLRSGCVEYYFYADVYNMSLPSWGYVYGRLLGLCGPNFLFTEPASFRRLTWVAAGLFMLPLALSFFLEGRKSAAARAARGDETRWLQLSLIILTGLLLQPLVWMTYYVAAVFPYMAVLYVLRRARAGARVVAFGLVGLSFAALSLSSDFVGPQIRGVCYQYKCVTWAGLFLYAAVAFALFGAYAGRLFRRARGAEEVA